MAQNVRPLKAVLSHPNKTIALLCLQINQQLALLERIKAVLPKELASHALHCLFHDNKLNKKKLLLYTDSAVWASQLRFYGKAILTATESGISDPVSVLQVKVINAPETADTGKKRIAIIPSQTVADGIRNHSIETTDPQLKQALKKLSSTLANLYSENN